MYEAMSIAATALTSQQRRIDTIADNVANINTAGFKAARVDFKDALYIAGGLGPGVNPNGSSQKGRGVMPASTAKSFEPGKFETTERDLDFAIEEGGFFEVTDQNGRRLYTKAGNFYSMTAEDGMYLVDSNGFFVQNDRGQRIAVPEGAQSVNVDPNGEISFRRGEELLGTDRFGIYTFENKNGLSSAGNGNYEPTAASGERVPLAEPGVRQGVLEGSNVELAEEMTLLIRAQRAFSLASRALTTADDMDGIANNLRR